MCDLVGVRREARRSEFTQATRFFPYFLRAFCSPQYRIAKRPRGVYLTGLSFTGVLRVMVRVFVFLLRHAA